MTRALVGREAELELLEGALAALGRGRGRLFLFTGEPGIGKTRLCDELATRAADAAATVVWGSAWDGGGAPAFWPWIEVVRALRPHLPAPEEPLRRDLGPLWDEGPGDSAAEPGPRDPDLLRFRRFDALRTVLHAAAARAPLVIILEDLHAADRDSLLALQFVARTLRTLPLLLVATHREADAGVDPGRSDLLARLGRDGTVVRLGRLDRLAVAAMLSDLDAITDAVVDEIVQTSGGNPLFIEETVRLLRTGASARAVPAGVRALVRDRLAQFEPRARAALAAATVLGREVAGDLLADVCARPPGDLRDDLRGPRRAGIVEELADGRVRFCHGLYREVLADDLAHAERAALHLAAARAHARRLAQGHSDAGEAMARHLLAALPSGDPAAAVDAAVRAGRAALAGLAFDRAVELLDGALAALAGLPPAPEQQIDLQLLLAEALVRSGRGERGRSLCLAAAAQARALGDGVRLAHAALAYGAELRIAVVDATLVGLLEEALATLGSDPARAALRARVMGRLAGAQQPARDPSEPVRLARAAITLARASDDPATLLYTLHSAGSALVDYAPPEERLPLSRELVTRALARGELTLALQGYVRLAIDCLELADRDGAREAIAAHERVGRALAHPRWRWRGPLLESMLALIDGCWDDAARAQADAAALAAQADDANALSFVLVHRFGALRAREADRPDVLPATGELPLITTVYTAVMEPLLRAATLARLGDDEGARRLASRVPFDAGALAHDPMALALYAELVIARGDRARAADVLAMLAPLLPRALTWGPFGCIWEGPATQWQAALLGLLDRHDEAVAAGEAALAGARAMAARPLTARLEHRLASLLLARGHTGDHARARELLASAAAGASSLGMVHLAARIARSAGEAPRAAPTPRPVSDAPVFTLTPATDSGGDGDVALMKATFQARTAILKSSRGLEILAELVRHPGREFHVLDFGAGDPGEVIDLGDAGEALDHEARTAYRQRIAALAAELREAEAWADTGRTARLRAELDFLTAELGAGLGLGGRDRRTGAAVERARSNVQKRVRGAIRKLAEALPELGEHLEIAVKTGTWVSYRPSHGVRVTV